MNLVSLENLKRFYTKLKEKMYLKTEIDTKLNGKANTSHTHDDRYYTESEINTKISTLNSNIANAGKFYGINSGECLYSKQMSNNGTTPSSIAQYTATKDCYAVITKYVPDAADKHGVFVYVNNVLLINGGNCGLCSILVPLKKGDVLKAIEVGNWANGYCAVYSAR